MSKLIDFVYSYKFLKLLSSPWEKTDAFKNGIIDRSGNILIPINQLDSNQQEVYTTFVRLVFNIKRILQNIPLQKTMIGSLFTTLVLIKENASSTEDYNTILEYLESILKTPLKQEYNYDKHIMLEDIENTTSMLPQIDRPLSLLKRKQFAGVEVFEVDQHTYSKSVHGKIPFKRWANYVDMESELGPQIKEYCQKNPNKPVILKDSVSGGMRYLKRK